MMIRRDLEPASVPDRDEQGRVADFHALRHTFISTLAHQNVPPKLAQELARHSDIRLTLGRYSHVQLHDLGGAVAGLPSVFSKNSEIESATGTDGARLPDLQMRQRPRG